MEGASYRARSWGRHAESRCRKAIKSCGGTRPRDRQLGRSRRASEASSRYTRSKAPIAIATSTAALSSHSFLYIAGEHHPPSASPEPLQLPHIGWFRTRQNDSGAHSTNLNSDPSDGDLEERRNQPQLCYAAIMKNMQPNWAMCFGRKSAE